MAAHLVDEEADEFTPLVARDHLHEDITYTTRGISRDGSIVSSQLPKDELALADTAVGERLSYAAYTTIDWLHDLVKDAFRYRSIEAKKGFRGALASAWEKYQGWIAAVLVGILVAVVAFFVDNAESSFGDLKIGYCKRNPIFGREACCVSDAEVEDKCPDWHDWSRTFWPSFVIYTGVAWVLAMVAALVTKLTKAEIPAFASHDNHRHYFHQETHQPPTNKTIYMAAGSGIPEIKLLLSGFEFPNLLSFRVLVVKAVGASLAVASGLCVGKEGPFVHISTSAGYIVSRLFPQYHQNGRKLREMLSVACSSALAVAFGSPIGGVLFVYEEMSSQFPRKVLWRAFLCSLISVIMLKSLNPSRTGRVVLFETNYGVTYKTKNYIYFIILGIAGGFFGAAFCKGSLVWTKRMKTFINKYPLTELSVLILVTSLLQYPNPITREPALLMIKSLLTDCQNDKGSWICEQERLPDKTQYYGWLLYGSIVKVVLTILTSGARIPSGLIVPALGAGAVFGRLVGQISSDTSPGIFAMVGASAFLAGVSRMTVSLTVIMFELTGEVEFIPPFMIAILTAKVVVDMLHEDGVNDHTVLGEFLEHEHATRIARKAGGLAGNLIPHPENMQDMTLYVGPEYKVLKQALAHKLLKMQRNGLRDAGLVIVDDKERLHGFLAEAELDFAVNEEGLLTDGEATDIRSGPLAPFVDRSSLTVNANAPLEMVVEMFYQLGLRHMVIVEEHTSRVVGVILKHRLVMYLEGLRGH